jgi:hypothetical protein
VKLTFTPPPPDYIRDNDSFKQLFDAVANDGIPRGGSAKLELEPAEIIALEQDGKKYNLAEIIWHIVRDIGGNDYLVYAHGKNVAVVSRIAR